MPAAIAIQQLPPCPPATAYQNGMSHGWLAKAGAIRSVEQGTPLRRVHSELS